jgi:hypothetical protein
MQHLIDTVDNLHLGIKPFKQQIGSQQRTTLSTLDKFLHKLSNNNIDALLHSYLSMPKHQHILASVETTALKPIIASLKSARDATDNRNKPVLASLVAPYFTVTALHDLGFPLSKDAFAAAHRHAHKYGPGFPAPMVHNDKTMATAMTDDTKQRLFDLCIKHSHPAANRHLQDANGVTQAARIFEMSMREVYRIWTAENPSTPVAQSSFYKTVKAFRIFKTARKSGTDMCAICLEGKHSQSQLLKQLRTHEITCPYAAALTVFTSLDCPMVAAVPDDTPECTCAQRQNHDDFVTDVITPFILHRRINHEQRTIYMTQRSTLQPGAAVLVVDYKQNIYVNRGPKEAGHMYYEHSMRSVLGMRLDWCDALGRTHIEYIDYLSTCLNHDGLFANDCIIDLVKRRLTPNGITTLSVWLDMAKHFIGREVSATLMHTLPTEYRIECHVNRFIEHHGKSPVDGHFSHLSRWILELESTQNIVSTRQIIRGLRERASSHAKGQPSKARQQTLVAGGSLPPLGKKRAKSTRRTAAAAHLGLSPAEVDKVTNVLFVEYRPACACNSNPESQFFVEWDDDDAQVGDSELQLSHLSGAAPSSLPTENEATSALLQSRSVSYPHDNHHTVAPNSDTTFLRQVERKQACTTPLRKRKFMNIVGHRTFYSFSSSPPTGTERVVVTARVLASD